MPSSKSNSDSSFSSNVTTDHEEIRQWVEERGGRPACVKETESGDSCLLRVDYPGVGDDERFEPLEWDEFFRIFDKEKLAFLYQDQTKDGGESRFSKFVARGSDGSNKTGQPGEKSGRKSGKSSGRSGGKSGGKTRSNS